VEEQLLPIDAAHSRGAGSLGSWTALLCFSVIGLALPSVFARLGAGPSWVGFAWALSFLPYAWLAFATRSQIAATQRGTLVAAVALASVVSLGAPPLFSDDVYRYLWDGHILMSGLDPYAFAPNDPALAAFRTELWTQINHPEVPTIYPPLAQAFFLLATLLGGSVWSVQLLGAAVHVGCTAWLAWRAPKAGLVPALLYGMNPLAVVETTMMGHLDVVVGFCVVLGAVCLAKDRLRAAILWFGAASAAKLIGIIIAPLLALRSWRAAALGVCVALLPLWFVLQAGYGSGEPGGVHQYARRWSGNAGAFVVIKAGCRYVVDRVAELNGSSPHSITLDPLRPILRDVSGSAFDPRLGVRGPKKPPADVATFPRHFVSGLLARVVSVSFAALLLLWLIRRRGDPLLSVRALLIGVLLLSPQVHPWYLLWILPVEALTPRRAVTVWSAIVLAVYAPLEHWLVFREWELSPWIVGLEYFTLAVILVVERLGETGNSGQRFHRWRRRFFAKARQIGDSTS